MSEHTYDNTQPGGIVLLAPVALLTDVPEDGLVRGQVGTVVEILPPNGAAVEFVDNQGRTYAISFLRVADLVALYHYPVQPIHQVA